MFNSANTATIDRMQAGPTIGSTQMPATGWAAAAAERQDRQQGQNRPRSAAQAPCSTGHRFQERPQRFFQSWATYENGRKG